MGCDSVSHVTAALFLNFKLRQIVNLSIELVFGVISSQNRTGIIVHFVELEISNYSPQLGTKAGAVTMNFERRALPKLPATPH